MRTQIGSLVQRQKDAELHLDKRQRDYIEIEIRKYRRRKLLQYHTLEQELLREVSASLDYARGLARDHF